MENKNPKNVTVMHSSFEESTMVKPEEVISHSLIDGDEVSQDLQANQRSLIANNLNFVAGIARFNLRGHRWHTFTFDIPTRVTPRNAVVSLGLMNIYNRKGANDLQYYIPSYSLSYVGRNVRVTGRIFVGDTDGYLYGLSYNCVVRF